MNTEKILVHSLAFGGKAAGKTPEGKVCFVRGGIPGELLSVRITADKKNYCCGELLEILESSPQRIRSGIHENCPEDCPGCSYRHIPYEMELEWKEKQFRSFAQKAHLINSPETFLRPMIGAPVQSDYRNKIRLSVEKDPVSGQMKAGYRGEDNVTLLEIRDCPLAHPAIRELLKDETWKQDHSVPEKSVTLRHTEKDGAFYYFDRGNPDHILTERLGQYGEFFVAENSFFQVNPTLSMRLAQEVLRLMKKCSAAFLAELYCGSGCFSILCAEQDPALHTLGIELDERAVALAGKNAELHHVENRCRFLAGDSAKVFRKKFPRGLKPGSVLLTDPPRTGMDPAARLLAAESRADFLIYISCSPDTLFRDLAYLEEKGHYRIQESFAVDLFPRTSHFESITFCQRMD